MYANGAWMHVLTALVIWRTGDVQKMPELIFQDSNHIYQLDGVTLPSVSNLCAPLHKAVYENVPKWQLEAAAERGTAVHLAAQVLDAAGAVSVEEEHLPYVRAYRDFLSEHSTTWSLTEKPLYHPTLLFAGTPDRYGLLDGKHTLLDIKTTFSVYKPLCRAQLNLYRMILIARGFPVERMAILHLKKDGTYKLIPMQEDEPLVLALITIYNALQKRRKKGANNV